MSNMPAMPVTNPRGDVSFPVAFPSAGTYRVFVNDEEVISVGSVSYQAGQGGDGTLGTNSTTDGFTGWTTDACGIWGSSPGARTMCGLVMIAPSGTC